MRRTDPAPGQWFLTSRAPTGRQDPVATALRTSVADRPGRPENTNHRRGGGRAARRSAAQLRRGRRSAAANESMNGRSPDRTAEGVEQCAGHGSWRSVADHALVHTYDRDDLSCCSGQKSLLRPEQILVAQGRLAHIDAVLLAKLEQVLACDPWQQSG